VKKFWGISIENKGLIIAFSCFPHWDTQNQQRQFADI